MPKCRFCKQRGISFADFLRYGQRHYAHYECYLKAGKKLEDLRDWQIGSFPAQIVDSFGLTAVRNAALARERKRFGLPERGSR